MGLFSKKPKTIACPVCSGQIEDSFSDKLEHWESHAYKITSGEGTGSFTWKCACGPADGYWPSADNAGAGLAQHMDERHGIPIA